MIRSEQIKCKFWNSEKLLGHYIKKIQQFLNPLPGNLIFELKVDPLIDIH